MREPAGHTLVLDHGPYRAEVVTVGAGLRTFTYGGRDLVAGYRPGEICPDYRGWVLQPWPNRVGHGRYDFGGATHQLPLTEPENGNALHGLAGWADWRVVHHDDTSATLRHELVPQAGYPFALDLEAAYRLDGHGLHVAIAATNVGPAPAPYGAGHHPYFTLDRPADDLELVLPATTWCPMDERGLPSPAEAVEGSAYDFRESRPIGDLVVDHPFGGLTGDTATLRHGDRAISVTLGEGCAWLHVFTCDTHEPARRAVAIEPMSCPPDAFRTGTDLVVLEPGATHRLAFTITGS
jgi:aldose 1-epimerase